MSNLNVTTDIPEHRRQDIEQLIARVLPGLQSVQLVDLPISDINIKESHANQARSEALQPELSAKYRRSLDLGAMFPPIVCTPKGVVVDGNHRVDAFLAAGRDRIPAYIVDINLEQFKLLTPAANGHNGEPNDENAQRLAALSLHATGAYGFQYIADLVGIPERTVANFVHADSARRRVNRPRKTGDMALTTLAKLDQIGDDEVLRMAVEAVSDARMTSKEVNELVQSVKKARTQTAAVEAIADAARNARARQVKPSKPKRAGDLTLFRQSVTLLTGINATALAISANGSSDQVARDVDACIDALQRIRKAVGK